MSILRQLLLLAGLAALAYAGYYGWQGYAVSRSATGTKPATAAAILVDAEPAALRTMTTTVEAVGSTIAARSIQVVSLAEGRVHALHFKAGQKVQEGAVLVELDRDLQEADLAEAEAVHKRAVADLERAQSLFGSKVVSEARVQELTALAAAAQAQVMRARRQLADRTIRAPFAGTVGLNRVDIGARVTEDTVITTLDDLSHVRIEFSVPENLFGVARIGHKVEATTAAYPGRVFTGRIIEVDSRIDSVSRSFQVRADLPNEDGALPAGMFMQVSMTLEDGEATVIPEEAVIANAGAAFVFVVEDGKAARRSISTGRRAYGVVEVTRGVEPDTLVVTRGNAKLRDGMAVRTNVAAEQNG